MHAVGLEVSYGPAISNPVQVLENNLRGIVNQYGNFFIV
jgi:hypothetical protein